MNTTTTTTRKPAANHANDLRNSVNVLRINNWGRVSECATVFGSPLAIISALDDAQRRYRNEATISVIPLDFNTILLSVKPRGRNHNSANVSHLFDSPAEFRDFDRNEARAHDWLTGTDGSD